MSKTLYKPHVWGLWGDFARLWSDEMLNLQLPEPTDFPASVFDQNGTLIFMGPRENCELLAEEVSGLYCWNVNGKPIIRKDYEVTE